MWVLGGDFYTANQIANFLTTYGTMDDAVVAEGHYFVVADRHGAILGSGGWTRMRPAYAKKPREGETTVAPTVRSVFVDPAATRRGIASAIMSRTEGDAAGRGVERLHLTATLSGFELYKAFGYETEEFMSLNFADGSQFKCIRMQKTLAETKRVASAQYHGSGGQRTSPQPPTRLERLG